MSEIFISYARSTERQATQVADALRDLGYGVWRDDAIPAHRAFAEVIEERLTTARAVVVVWSKEAAKSEWVQSEADRARADHKLIQLTVDGAPLPMPFDRIQCADLTGWFGDPDAPGWKKVVGSVAELAGQPRAEGKGVKNRPASGVATLAVLPFANSSSDAEQGYFSDGLAEELMSRLAQVRGLRVTGRTSAFVFRDRNVDLRAIGQALSVEYVLEGSVRRAGPRLRIAARLVNCADGYQLWSQTFDRQLNDVFAIQDEVAAAVARSLSVTLGVVADRGGTRSFEAYDHFLRGRFLPAVVISREDLHARVAHLTSAVAIDPRYAQAWASLANLAAYAQPEGDTQLEAIREVACERALALAPDLPAACVAEGWLAADRRDWLAAEAAFSRAVTAGPGQDPAAEGIVGAYLTDMGRIRQGLLYRERARNSDPLALGWSAHVLGSHLTLRQWAEFDAEYARSAELPGARTVVETFRLARLIMGKAPNREISDQFEIVGAGHNGHLLHQLANVHTSPSAALQLLRQSLDGPSDALFLVAEFAGAYGDHDLAIEALQKATPHARLIHLQRYWRPELAAARADPRFKNLMRDLGLPSFWRISGKWPDFARPVGAEDYEFTG